ncbi:MAG: 3-phosphoshikimate 1-carboxyvinyltransferase [Oscillospiraceae bacterium]
MDLRLLPAHLQGSLTPPSSKSLTHRYLLGAALSGGKNRLENLAEGEDIAATRRCLSALAEGDDGLLDCGASGSTLRFLIPTALALRGGGRFTGTPRLMERSLEPYFALFRDRGIAHSLQDGVLTLSGTLSPGDYALRGELSSQFATGLLFALPLLEAPSVLHWTTPPVSRSYLSLTEEVLRHFDVWVQRREDGYFIPGRQRFSPVDTAIEGDWSAAACWEIANRLGGDITLTGLNPASLQGDRAVLTLPGQPDIDATDCPDLVPLLALYAALQGGKTTTITGAARLRDKESDRLTATAELLNTLGGAVTETGDGLHIRGVERLHGGSVSARGDHRLAMLAAIAATATEEPIVLQGGDCVAKSYPDFWRDYTRLGGRVEEV